MKLSEIKTFERGEDDDEGYRRQDDAADAAHREYVESRMGDFIAEYDSLKGPDGSYYGMIDVEVSYEIGEDDSFDHEFGTDTIPGEVQVTSLRLTDEANLYDQNEKVIQTFPAGFDVEKLPGFKSADMDFFQSQADDHVS